MLFVLLRLLVSGPPPRDSVDRAAQAWIARDLQAFEKYVMLKLIG